MRFIFSMGLLASGALRVEAADATWIEMFNGKDLAGWEGDPVHWEVRDGLITTKGRPSANTFLFWNSLETDFILRAEVKVEGTGEANSGIQFRSQGHLTGASGSKYKVCGPQADIGPEKYGALYQECQGRIIPPDASKCRSAGRADGWDGYELKVDGPRWSLAMNGVTCFEHTVSAGSPFLKAGMVALQYHAPGYAARFRNLRLQRLGTVALHGAPGGKARVRAVPAPQPFPWTMDGRRRMERPWRGIHTKTTVEEPRGRNPSTFP